MRPMAAATKDALSGGSSLLAKPYPVATRSLSSSFLGAGETSSLFLPSSVARTRKNGLVSSGCRKVSVVPVAAAISERTVRMVPQRSVVNFTVTATVTVRRVSKEDVRDKLVDRMDAFGDLIGRNVSLELVSTEIDPWTKGPKKTGKVAMKGWFEKRKPKKEKDVYTVRIPVDSGFGTPGAVIVNNRHRREFFLESVVVEGFVSGPVHFNCHSWVQPICDGCKSRVFFTDMPYLPSETPAGLRNLREEELRALRGDGTGQRKLADRIYDYDTYNDLGNPDKGVDWTRPTLGGSDMLPYPRRCRTGRPPTDADAEVESRVEAPSPIYVPRDEAFEEGKQKMMDEGQRKAMLHVFVPSLVATSEECHDFQGFHEMDSLYKIGVRLKNGLHEHLFKNIPLLPKLQGSEAVLRYDTPSVLTKDRLSWLRDDHFARQAIAGINPVSIESVRVFPPVSKLDPETYGPQVSAIREEHIVGHLDGMSVQQAIEEKKLFMVDYHDMYLPFLERINSQPGRKAYATRTLYFLTPLGTLKPIAIELSLPPGTAESRWKQVVTPPVDATGSWVWQLAKAHVCSNDAGVHQLINHWLRTHACMEPFILAAHRQMSTMHPVFKLLQPHMRYTLQINALARQILISGNGVIESFFTPGCVCMEMSSAAYRSFYRFDQENLPADLIRRGMAEEDPTQPEGIRLVVEDYPYASDGLMIWSAIKKWVTTYVNAHYSDSSSVQSDFELQQWYSEAINVGHEDLREAAWWPRLTDTKSLIDIITTIIWVSSAQHAALNFAQYPLGGYIPNRPPLMRRLIPQESDPEYKCLLANPEEFYLSSLPSLLQATKFMTVIDTLSTHSEDEEYLGERGRQTYSWSAEIAEAFNEYAAEIRKAEDEIQRRNEDTRLRNRCGAGVLPYELLAPSSGPGITCRGVPNSITI